MQTDLADQIAEASLGRFLNEATRLTWQQFCWDCPKKHDHCFPCRSARTMIRVYLAALVQVKAVLN
ncbi:hypothetical protein ES703_12191 [subsurface metagenome]